MDNSHNHIEAFYDLPGVEGVTKFVHWIDAQLMAWSAFFLILSLVLIGLDNTTSYVSKSGFLTGVLGISFAISVESQARILFKYARMSWDNGKRFVASMWFLCALPVFAVAFLLAWTYMVKAAEGVSYVQATMIVGLGVRDIELGRAATLIYLIGVSALAYFVKPRESLEQKLAAKHEEAELAKADAEVIEAKQIRQNAIMRSAAKGALDGRQVAAAAFLGKSAEPAPSMTSAVDRAGAGMPIADASSFYSARPEDDDEPPTPPTGGGLPQRALPSGSGAFGARGRPSLPITAYRDYEQNGPGANGKLIAVMPVVADIKDFLLSESRRFSRGEITTIPTQRDVMNYLNSCGYGLKAVNDSLKFAIASALRELGESGTKLAWDEENVPQVVNG